MRFAVLSDIHGNHVALEAVLNEVKSAGVDGFIFLGDYVTDFPGGPQVMDRLYECADKYQCVFIRGNREDYMLKHRHGDPNEWIPGTTTTGALYHAYKSLRERDLDFFESIPFARDIFFPGAPVITACHASPYGSRENIFNNRERIKKCLGEINGDIMLCGHQHTARTEVHGKKFVSYVGSVGLANGYPGCAQYAYISLKNGRWQVENHAIPYDIDAAFAEFDTSGLSKCGGYWARAVRAAARSGLCLMDEFSERGYAAVEAAGDVPDPEVIWGRTFEEMDLANIDT